MHLEPPISLMNRRQATSSAFMAQRSGAHELSFRGHDEQDISSNKGMFFLDLLTFIFDSNPLLKF